MTQDLTDILAKLGPCPPWWRPLARRRWYLNLCAELERSAWFEAGLQRMMVEVMAAPRS